MVQESKSNKPSGESPGVTPASGRLLRWTLFICLAAGALGVLSGFCIFLLVQEKVEQPRGWVFLLVLGVAALASFVIEYFRDVIKHGHVESLGLSRVLVTVVTLMMFELFILAWEAIPEKTGTAWQEVPAVLLGPALEGMGHPWLNLSALAAIWVVAGVTLACTLGVTALDATDLPLKRQIAMGARRGVIAGAVAAPVGTLLFVLLARVALATHAFIFEHAVWKRHLVELSEGKVQATLVTGFVPLRYAFWAFVRIDDLFHRGWWGPILGVALLVAIGLFVFNTKPNYLSFLLIAAVVIVIFGPILADLGTLLLIPIFAALVWCVPGVLLGMATPLLRRPSELQREWGLLALVAAIILVIVTWSRFPYWYLLPALLLVIAAAYFRRGAAVEDYWPVVALSVGIIISGVVWIAQKATFAGVLGAVHKLNSLPVYLPSAKPPEPFPRLQSPSQWSVGTPLGGDHKNGLPGAGPPPPDQMTEQQLKEFTAKYIIKSPEEDRERQRLAEEKREEAARSLELSLSGSLGFWVTVGILATWAVRRHADHPEPEQPAGAEGIKE
ncbi:MAG: hypothetical protein JWN24_3757 [Phycisphaerales bacterium]|nr:hypothetical protein [Phycisphaerales bacterium]